MTNLSPAVVTREFALDLSVEQTGSATGGTVGLFEWGPANEPVLVNNETTLRSIFGLPSETRFVDFWSASNFLSYTNRLFVTRVVPDSTGDSTTAYNASAAISTVQAGDPTLEKTYDDTNTTDALVKNQVEFDNSYNTLSTTTDNVVVAKYPGAYANNITVSMVTTAAFGTWTYKDAFDISFVSKDQVALVVLLNGEIVEQFVGFQNSDAVSPSGGSDYLEEIVNRSSSYINLIGDNLFTEQAPGNYSDINFEGALIGGSDGDFGTTEDGERQFGWDLYINKEDIEVDLLFVGGASPLVGQYVDQNVAQVRQDCVVFLSPEFADVVGISNISTVVTNVVATRQVFGSTSYAAMDGNYKYQYDRFADKYRWLPLNGDIAGIHARTDFDRDAWWAAAGHQRGQIKNTVKLAYNPSKAFRDELYKNGINPVANFKGDGPLFYGNKTLLNINSSFSRINVRRLFNVLKRSISRMARAYLFEFNDRFTRSQFVQAVVPFLRLVQSRRGIFDFRVQCDDKNNTGEIIDNYQFIGDIYIKPARAIETIFLNFIAAKTGVDFEEITFNSAEV